MSDHIRLADTIEFEHRRLCLLAHQTVFHQALTFGWVRRFFLIVSTFFSYSKLFYFSVASHGHFASSLLNIRVFINRCIFQLEHLSAHWPKTDVYETFIAILPNTSSKNPIGSINVYTKKFICVSRKVKIFRFIGSKRSSMTTLNHHWKCTISAGK